MNHDATTPADERPRICIAHGGELAPVEAALRSLGLGIASLPQPHEGLLEADLLVATLDLAQEASAAVVAGATRIAASDRPIDSAEREQLQQAGFRLVVQQQAHPELWRLLARWAVFGGDDRRQETRATLGSEVAIAVGRQERDALLLDLSNRGCRVLCTKPARTRERVQLDLGSQPELNFRLEGVVARVGRNPDVTAAGVTSYTLAIVFDALEDSVRTQLSSLLDRLSFGAPGEIETDSQVTLPACASASVPGLTLDDETDPPIPARLSVAIARAPGSEWSQYERRRHDRRPISGSLVTGAGSAARALIARDLSAGGLLAQPLEGTPRPRAGNCFDLALYGPGRVERHVLRARVIRDDPERGLALRFEGLSPGQTEGLTKLIDSLPTSAALVEALGDEGESDEAQAILLAEILPGSRPA